SHHGGARPHRRLRLDPCFFGSLNDEHSSLDTGVLDRGPHQRVDKLVGQEFAGDGTQSLDHRRRVESCCRGTSRRWLPVWLMPDIREEELALIGEHGEVLILQHSLLRYTTSLKM